MRFIVSLILLLNVSHLLNCFIADAGQPSAQEILNRVDDLKVPKKSYRNVIKISEYMDGKLRYDSTVALFKKFEEKIGKYVVVYIDPPRDVGNTVLVFPGKIWQYQYSTKASIRISNKQRLLGHVSVADVLNQYFSADYKGKLIGAESVQDADRKPVKTWHLDLVKATENAGYARAECWIAQDSYKIIKCKYYSDSGRHLKTLFNHKFATAIGVTTAMESIIIDALNPKSVTTMESSDFSFRDIPEKWFQKDFLPYLKAD